ncbi:protein vreteno [Bactrocera oleae]|uniref:protein vreteno n=1 Tax=Bactrocera oleae TaxID=104688 RepID=UPI00387E2FDB
MDYKAKRNKRAQINNAVPYMSPQAAGENYIQHNGIKQNVTNSPKQNAGNHSIDPTFQTGECTACRKPSICVCERCGDFYCSPGCQKKDWQSHRYICFPMPKLVQPTSVLTTDAVYPANAPLLTVNQISHTNPFKSIQRTQQQPQNLRNNSQQNHSLTGHPQLSDTNGQQQQTNIKAIQKANNKDAKQTTKVTTTTVPTVDLPKTNSHVTLTGFRTPNRCYVRAVNPSVEDDTMLNARKIDGFGKVAKPLSAMPKLHSYAIAPYNGIMHRVEVLFARNPANIRVLFIDRGVIATRNLRDLREISDEIISLKQYTCMIQLRNVCNYVLSEKLVKHFASYEDLDFKIKYKRVENGVDLLHWQTEKSLNDEVEQFCKESGAEVWTDGVRVKQNTVNNNTNANTIKQPNSAGDSQNVDEPHDEQFYALQPSSSTANSHVSVQQKQAIPIDSNGIKEAKKRESVIEVEHPTMKAPFEIHYFKMGCDPFKAVVLDVSCLEIGYLGCIAQDDLECLQIVHKQLESITVSDKPYKPQLEEYCIAKFEEMWYRAQVFDIPNESEYTVMYIDFTNEATLKSTDIRHFPASATGACKTSLCLIDGLPTNLSAELIRFLNEEIKLQTLITIDRVKNIDEQVVVVECKSLLDKIRKNNLLT